MDTVTCKECGEEAEVMETKLEDGVDRRAICDCGGVTRTEDIDGELPGGDPEG